MNYPKSLLKFNLFIKLNTLQLTILLASFITLNPSNVILAQSFNNLPSIDNSMLMAQNNKASINDLWQSDNINTKSSETSNSDNTASNQEQENTLGNETTTETQATNNNETNDAEINTSHLAKKLIAIASLPDFEHSKFVNGLYWPSIGPFKQSNDDSHTMVDIHNNKLVFTTDKNNNILGLKFYFDIDKITSYTMLNLQVVIDFLLEAIGGNAGLLSDFNDKFNNVKDNIDSFTLKKPLTLPVNKYLIDIATVDNDNGKTIMINLASSLNHNVEPVLARNNFNYLKTDKTINKASNNNTKHHKSNNPELTKSSIAETDANLSAVTNKPNLNTVSDNENNDSALGETTKSPNSNLAKTNHNLFNNSSDANTNKDNTTSSSINQETKPVNSDANTNKDNTTSSSINQETKPVNNLQDSTSSETSATSNSTNTSSNNFLATTKQPQANQNQDNTAAKTKANSQAKTTSTDKLKGEFLDLISSWQKAKQEAVKICDTTKLNRYLGLNALKRQQDAITWLKTNHKYYELTPLGVNITKYEAVDKNSKYLVFVEIKENSKLMDETTKKSIKDTTDKYNVKYTILKINGQWFIVDSAVVTQTTNKKN